MADDNDDWFSNMDEEPAAEPEAATAAAAPVGGAKAAGDAPQGQEGGAPAGEEGAAPEEPPAEEEYLDPDKLLLFKHWIR